MKIFTAPQHTRSILPLFHPTKFFACLAGRYFSFGKLYLESYISRLNAYAKKNRNDAPRKRKTHIIKVMQEHGIAVKESRDRLSYCPPGRTKFITHVI